MVYEQCKACGRQEQELLPSKQSKYRKIDGFAAFLNAHTEVIPMLSQLQGDGNIEFISVNDLFK